jgi:ParB family chromosome partitioning protein
VVGAANFLPNMGTDDFLSCLSRVALEGSCKDTPVLPRQKMKDTRIALVEHFREGRFVHPAALFAPDKAALLSWLAKNAVAEDDAADDQVEDPEAGDTDDGEASVEDAFREAAE